MSPITEEMVRKALRSIIDRHSGQDVISAGMISGIVLRGNKVGFVITVSPEYKEYQATLRQACEAAVAQLPGIASVTAVLTAHDATPIPPRPESGYAQPRERAVWNLTPLEHVNSIIAIASGKGGVGKSTTAVNLALAMQRSGQRVGLLDADIYGPSLPRMLGIPTDKKPDIVDGKMIPPENHGVVCMSMGFISGDQAAVLRGPMISKALHQMLRFTRWGSAEKPLDTLLIDMPPGTGDIHLSLAQAVPLTGAIIVTTPQEVAVMDAAKALSMFEKTGVRVLGVIENMSYYEDTGGNRVALFGEGGGRRLAKKAAVPFLGEVPIDASIGYMADRGDAYTGAYAKIYQDIASAFIPSGRG